MSCLTPGPALVITRIVPGMPPLRGESHPGAPVDDQQPAIGIPPDRALQRVELVARQKVFGALPDQRRLGDMRVAIEGREILGHRREALNWHAVPPRKRWGERFAAQAGMRTGNERMPW